MQHLSPAGRSAVSELSQRYNLSPDAVEHMLIAVNIGAGSMAQFNCSELGGSGQWMRGGMTMVGDMFNHGLKSKVDNLCNELSHLLANTQVFARQPGGTNNPGEWWPEGLGTPMSTGTQNSTRYAVFTGRLVVNKDGEVTVYDTLDHQICGVSQQQGGDTSLSFSSQEGTMSVKSLPVVTGAEIAPSPDNNVAAAATSEPTPVRDTPETDTPVRDTPVRDTPVRDTPVRDRQPAAPSSEQTPVSGIDVLALIEKLAQLHDAGVLSDSEFSAKKQELLARL